MTDAFLGLLPYAPSLAWLAGLALVSTRLYRLWVSALRQGEKEREAHRLTNVKLDAERDARRRVEDEMDKVTREARALRAENDRLRIQLGEPT